jgi:hypothetical protein
MRGRPTPSSLVLVVLALAAVLAGCRVDRSPRRVPDDGAPCSAVMPGAPKKGESTFRLDSVVVTEHAWGLLPPEVTVDPPKDSTVYAVRRATVPAGAVLRDAALLDAAAARVGRGIALQSGTKATVARVPTSEGEAVELRWTWGQSANATRLFLIPGGLCEVTILGAHTEAQVAAYFASAQVQARP